MQPFALQFTNLVVEHPTIQRNEALDNTLAYNKLYTKNKHYQSVKKVKITAT